jgi:hypothetical protein
MVATVYATSLKIAKLHFGSQCMDMLYVILTGNRDYFRLVFVVRK